MKSTPFNEFTLKQIEKVIQYSKENIYQTDDVLDMMNNQLEVPGTKPQHNILVPIGRWICYYIVDHPIKGRCHYFQIKTDAMGAYADKSYIDYLVEAFNIPNTRANENITVDTKNLETKILIPFL